MAEGFQGYRPGMLDGGEVRHVHPGEDLHAPARAGIAAAFEFLDDFVAHVLQLLGAAGDQHHARAGDGQEPPDLAADAR